MNSYIWALIIKIGFGGILDDNYCNNEPPNPDPVRIIQASTVVGVWGWCWWRVWGFRGVG